MTSNARNANLNQNGQIRAEGFSEAPADGSPISIVGNTEATATSLNQGGQDANHAPRHWNVWAFNTTSVPVTLCLLLGTGRAALTVNIPPMGSSPTEVLKDFIGSQGVTMSAYVNNAPSHAIKIYASKLRF